MVRQASPKIPLRPLFGILLSSVDRVKDFHRNWLNQTNRGSSWKKVALAAGFVLRRLPG